MALKTSQHLIAFNLLLLFVFSTSGQSKNQAANSYKFTRDLIGSQKGQSVEGLRNVKKYLQKFGYLQVDLPSNKTQKASDDIDDNFDEILESSIRTYQENYHLKVTGRLDQETMTQMTVPRCGVPDIFNSTKNDKSPSPKSFSGFIADYAFFPGSPRWSKKHLTYKFTSSSAQQVPGTQDMRSIISSAFQRWAQVTDFTFQEVESYSDSEIEIGFYSGDHGDGYPFDGRGGTYAHAFPPASGNFHLDADENWSSNPGPDEVDLESVSVHEIGHLLGLAHSVDHPEAVMYPYLAHGMIKRSLQQDDIQGIHALYGL